MCSLHVSLCKSYKKMDGGCVGRLVVPTLLAHKLVLRGQCHDTKDHLRLEIGCSRLSLVS
jgi:hypothetical protein